MDKVKFGLVAQGHIPTIEAELKRWNDRNPWGNDMTYCSAVWKGIGKKIGWCPFTASLAYFEYLKRKQEKFDEENKLICPFCESDNCEVIDSKSDCDCSNCGREFEA